MAHACKVLAAQLLCVLLVFKGTWATTADWTSSLVICGPHRFLWSCDASSNRVLLLFLLFQKCIRRLQQQFFLPIGWVRMVQVRFFSSSDAFQRNRSNAKAHRLFHILPLWQWLRQGCKSLFPSSPGALELAIWTSSCRSSVFVRDSVSQHIPFKVNTHTHVV